MKVDLHQLNILVTRPDPAGSLLCEFINEHGGCAYHFPTLAIQTSPDISLLQNEIKKLDQHDWLIFISPQSVYASEKAIKTIWPKLPDSWQLAAIGESTKTALLEAGFSSIVCPADWSSEGLLNLSQFQFIDGKKIAIIKGEGGRKYLADVLQARGAKITDVIAYHRTLSDAPIEPILQLVKQNQLSAIVCASFQTVSNLKQLIGDAAWLDLKKIPLVVVSDRIKELADDIGFQTIWVARNASHNEVLTVLRDIAMIQNR